MSKNSPIILVRCRATQSVEKAIASIEAFLRAQANTQFQLHIVLPFSFLEPVHEHFRGDDLVLGTEILLDAQAESFPAPIAAQMALEANARFALIGSAIERAVYNPTPQALQSKVQQCLEKNLTPVVCIADTWEQYSAGESKKILKEQLVTFMEVLSKQQRRKTYVLYDAAWINDSNWESNDALLQQAYRNYREVLEEIVGDPMPDPSKIIYPIPSYGPDLAKVMTWLPVYGYFLGSLDALNTYAYPAIEYVPLPEIPASEDVEEHVESTHVLVDEDQPLTPATEESSYTIYAMGDHTEEHVPRETVSLPEDRQAETSLTVEDQPPEASAENQAYTNYAESDPTSLTQAKADTTLSDDYKNYLNHFKDSPLVVDNRSSEPEFDIDLEDKPQK